MRFVSKQLSLPGVVLLSPAYSQDARGFSATTFSGEEFEALGIRSHFVEGYTSYSKKDVIRGLHFQRAPHAQDKLVRCSQGDIYAVVADCDPRSPTAWAHVAVRLAGTTQQLLFVPGSYAFGFCVTGEGALVEYKLSSPYHPESAGGVAYNDPKLAIPWPTSAPLLSERDAQWPFV